MKVKRFSYVKPVLTGSAIGGITGATTQLIRGRKEKDGKQKSRAIKGAIVGATIGGTLGAGSKYAKKRYKAYIGKPIKADIEQVRQTMSPGDIVIADRGAYQHYGIVGKDGKIIEYGSEKFDPRTANVGYTSLDHFSNGSALRIEKAKGPYTPEEVVSRAESWIGKDRGQYNLRNNNCEHFAREMVSGKASSTQADRFSEGTFNRVVRPVLDRVDSVVEAAARTRNYSAFTAAKGDRILAQQFRHFVGNDLYNVRGKLTKELGGLSHFNKHQTEYLSGGGSVIGSLVGREVEGKKAKKAAINKYGLEKGSLEYDNFVRSRKNAGMIKGAATGGLLGAGLSKGIDAARGKVITDKALVKYGNKLDLGKNYMSTGKSLRGITSEKDIDTIISNYKETGDYLNGLKNML
jgi:hypothetical protein